MVNKIYSNSISEYTHENGGRVILLFLLFLLAIYEFIHAGFNLFAIVCLIPALVLVVYALFRWRMTAFWALIFVNYFLQMKDSPIPSGAIPMSLWDEMLEVILLAIAIIDARQTPHFEKCANLMLFAISIWCGLCALQLFNDTCGLGINVGSWFTSFRLMALHLVWILLVFCIYISTPQILMNYLRVWALLALFSAYWTWKQKNLGFTPTEYSWLYFGPGQVTHVLNAGTLIRYFSTFSDAASYGCNAAASSVVFLIVAITSKITWERIFFLLISICVIWGMFQSGTRTAIFCMAGGFMVYIILSKSFKIAIPFGIFFVLFMAFLVFTDIGNGNQQIRRMRSAFDKSDKSANVRDINKTAIRKYLRDAPWGLGIGSTQANIPANNKYRKLSDIPPDSEYVYIWVHTGYIGITVFLVCMAIMLIGACWIVMFKLKSPSLIGIGGGLCSAFVAIQLGGYANQILFQYPNGLTFFGGLAIVYILPYIEPEWIEYEKQRLAKIEEKKRLKFEKKLASRV
ncbi:MAG: O-antigen ligase family protein [Prevotella sp.]|nr:O-antigen ligase family protein [Prevotella sp.]